MDFSIEEIAKRAGGRAEGNLQARFSTLLTDSRSYVSGQKSLFVAIVSSRNDGHQFIAQLYDRGLRCFLISDNSFPVSDFPEAGFVITEHTLKALQKLAAYKRSLFTIPVTAITGSNGKTIVKEWLYQLMNDDLRICRSPKSFNSQIGVPLSVWQLNETHEAAFFEAGISQEGEMDNLQQIILPEYGIITNIKTAHDEHFSSRQAKTREKLKLFHACKKVFFHADEVLIKDELKQYLPDTVKTYSWGKAAGADLYIQSVNTTPAKTEISARYHEHELRITIPFTDEASVENACMCWLFLLENGLKQDTIIQRMMLLEPVAMRLEMKQGINNSTLINDTYNSDLESLSIALDFLNRQHQHPKKTIILSDIYQSGKEEKELYMDVARLLSSKKVNRLIGIGPKIKQHARFFAGEKHFFDSTDNFTAQLNASFFYNEAILLKGSRNFEFEKISGLLQQKSHDTVLEINLASLVSNLNYFKSKLQPGTGLMAMVKAFSYGSGSYEIASALQYHHVNYLAVAYADEGVQLRQGGINLPIMVMNPEPQSFDSLLQYNLEPEIFSFRILQLFSDFVKKSGAEAHIHLKLDTGMHRLGFEKQDLPLLMKKLKEVGGLKIASVFSHLAASDEPELIDFTREQIRSFTEMSELICSAFPYKIIRHISNSAGIHSFKEAQFDMVRLGIGLYGISANADEQRSLANVSTLKTTISQIRQVEAGDTVGYSRKGKVEKATRVATVPLGYADGFSRKLSGGKGKMYVKGKPCPVIGNVCMDMTMIDLGALSEEEVNEGDEVIIFDSADKIKELAKAAGTISYEIMTSISGRVKRIYLHE